ncbi:DUF5984 family protein [Paraherbaspirillum soli]|uniref:DUF5984 family protein n=1 Tax=Paraherbaspirillum soli TaxID=631222 RepID=A0ABW0M9I8_9BURK
MPLFEFDLTKLEEVAPWGTPPNQTLHWFGLTDGVYHLDVKGKQLFRYSAEIIAHWQKQDPQAANTPFVNYQVVRLWEDLFDLLADVLEPIPDALFQFIETPDSQKSFENKIQTLIGDDESDERIELYFEACEWIRLRQLDSMHLVEGPRIWMFRHKDEIIIRWDHQERRIDGIQPWAEIKGEEKYSVAVFIAEVISFHERLMNAMEARVDCVVRGNSIPDVSIDLVALANEHRERKGWLVRALNRPPKKLDPDRVLSAIAELERSRHTN